MECCLQLPLKYHWWIILEVLLAVAVEKTATGLLVYCIASQYYCFGNFSDVDLTSEIQDGDIK